MLFFVRIHVSASSFFVVPHSDDSITAGKNERQSMKNDETSSFMAYLFTILAVSVNVLEKFG